MSSEEKKIAKELFKLLKYFVDIDGSPYEYEGSIDHVVQGDEYNKALKFMQENKKKFE